MHALACADSPDLLIFETCEDVGQKRWRPNRIVVCENDDICCGVFDAVAHLQALVSEWDCEDAYALWIDLVGEVLEGAEHLLFCDDDDLFRVSGEPAACGVFEFVSGINGGYDDGDVFGWDVSGIFGDRNRLVGICGRDTDEIPQIAVESENKESVVSRQKIGLVAWVLTDPMTPKGTTRKQE